MLQNEARGTAPASPLHSALINAIYLMHELDREWRDLLEPRIEFEFQKDSPRKSSLLSS